MPRPARLAGRGRSQLAEPGALLPRSPPVEVVVNRRVWGDVAGVRDSGQRGAAGEAGSAPFLDRGTSGGSAVETSNPMLRLGNTGSIRGWRDSSGGFPPPTWHVAGREGGSRGGIGGGGEESRGGIGGIGPTFRGFGGSGGGLPTGMGGMVCAVIGPEGKMMEILMGSSRRPALSSLGDVWKLGVTGVDTGDCTRQKINLIRIHFIS